MNLHVLADLSVWKRSTASKKRCILKTTYIVILTALFATASHAQNLITVPFNNGFVGLNTGNNSAGSCYYFSGAQGLGWSNVQFAQNSPTNIFVAQGNDIIGSVLITDFNGVEYEIPGFIKWRTPSGGSPSTMVFSPNVGSSFTLATNGFNGSSTYTITNGNYIGLTFNGQTLTISPVPGTVTGNAATNGLLDVLNNYLASFADMSVSDVTVNEGAGTVTITVTISTTVTGTVTVNYATSDGTALAGLDYTSTSGSLTFLSGVTSQTFTVPILNDVLIESSEGFTVTLTDPINVSLLDPIASVTIVDNDFSIEICNGIDDDGDGQIDEGVLLTFYADTDSDGFGDASSSVQACSAPSGYVSNNTDCNDSSASINPNTVWYLDADGDGYYVSTATSCTSPGANYNTIGGINGDCNDNNASVNAASTEVCNGIDDNCNGQIDEGVLLTFYADTDGDGFGDPESTTLACTAPEGYVTDNTDCNDENSIINPNATEQCNAVDDNCNGQIDEGLAFILYYLDADGDGFGDPNEPFAFCSQPEGYVSNNFDCDDTNASINPTLAWYLDADNDGYYVNIVLSCLSPGSGYNTTGGINGDCNDNNASVNAASTEVCNGIDDNCNGQIDEGVLLTFYADTDGDGFGDAESTTLACTAPEGYVTDNTDCNDASATIYPGANEICNTIDDNCNTLIDDGVVFITYYADADGDGFGGTTSIVACAQPEGYVTDNMDCNDASATVYPGATEICNTIDDNCNGQIDEGVLLTFYADADGDGFGDAGSSVQACTAPEGYVTDNTDCDDTDALNDSNSAPFAANTEITIETHEGNTSIALAELVSDSDGDILNFSVVENTNVSLVGSDINITWSADFVGTISIEYVVCDQGGNSCDPGIECDTAAVTVFIYNGNPIANNDSASISEDEIGTISVTDNDIDSDGSIDSSTVDLDPNTTGIQTDFTSANGQWNVDGNGLLTFTPNSNFNGVDSLNYVVQDNDGLFSNDATVVITVNAINDQVQANDDNSTAVEGSTSTIDVASNDTDTDGIVDLNTIEIITLPSHGNASVNVNGQIEFIPNSNFDGLDSLAYVICDNGLPLPAQCDTAWVFITISSCVSNPLNDCDNDGLANEEEVNNGTDPLNPDSDGDGVIDGTELVDNTNPIDPCNLVLASVSVTPSVAWYAIDCDGDSIPNGEENGTDPLNPDTDGDGVTDADEIQDGTNPTDPCSLILASISLTPSPEWYALDCDGDSIPNGEENGTDPLNPDTDGDGVTDADEIQDGTNPADPCSLILASVTLTPSPEWYTLDCDGDSIPNGEENGTDPLNPDTDGDGVTDADEIQDGTNPADPCSLILASVTLTPSPEWYTLDCDGDSIPNGEENGTDPLNPDTDGDGVTDADEIQDGTDPTNPCEFLASSITVQVDASWFEVDCDNDGLTNAEELIGNLEWNDPDTDGDGVLDGTEIVDGTSPLDPCQFLVTSITLTPEFDWIALDCDNDGLDNGAELSNNTNPLNPDTDGDGVTDGTEVGDITNPLNPCEYLLSSVTLNSSANWYALDCDGDSLSNGDELANNTDVFNPDTDGDGVTDGTEISENTVPTDPCSLVLSSITLTPSTTWVDLDCDNDSLSNGNEVAYNTDPFNPDTDGDGVIDGTEVADATVPTDPCSLTFASITLEPSIAWGELDCDGDSLTNAEEILGGIDPFNPDTDGDGVTDGTEALDGTDPLDPCSYIFTSQTVDPSSEWENLDCDGDGLTNLEEASGGSDPNDPCSPVPCDIIIPQAITPNNDGNNDVLVINGLENYPNHELIIFNRWGAEVFRATDYQNNWNGSSQSNLNIGGDELPSGTYYYLFDTKEEGNEVMKGFIYLKR